MSVSEQSKQRVAKAVDSAISQLVSVRHSDQSSMVGLPIFYPSGAAVTVIVEAVRAGFYVTDGGFAYREIAMVGGEALFQRTAKRVAEFIGVDVNSRKFFATAPVEQLASAIADVAAASERTAHTVIERISNRHDNELAMSLYRRLTEVFGSARVEPEAKIKGASTREWDVSDLVHLDGHQVAFDIVTNNHASVYASSTKFHDLSLLAKRPITVSVVRDKKALGSYLAILSQASHVIQDNVPDEVFAKAAALPKGVQVPLQ